MKLPIPSIPSFEEKISHPPNTAIFGKVDTPLHEEGFRPCNSTLLNENWTIIEVIIEISLFMKTTSSFPKDVIHLYKSLYEKKLI